MDIPPNRLKQKDERAEEVLAYVRRSRKEAARTGEAKLVYRTLITWVMRRFGVAESTARRYVEIARKKEREEKPELQKSD